MEVIYADVYFLVNMSMDHLALFICSRLRKTPLRTRRALFASALGGAYAVAELNMSFGPLSLLLSAAIPFLMCYVCFGYIRAGHFFLNTLTFFLTSFLMGGVMTALYFFAGKLPGAKKIYINGSTETVYSGIPLWAMIVCSALCAALTLIWNRISDKRLRTTAARFSIRIAERTISGEGLCDSGNILSDPIGGLPVIVITPELESRLVPGGMEKMILSDDIKVKKRIRLIPYRTVSGGGIMYGCIPDSVIINGVERSACVCAGSDTEGFDGYGALIPPSLI